MIQILLFKKITFNVSGECVFAHILAHIRKEQL